MQILYIKTQFTNINPPFNIKNTYQTQKYLYTNAYAGNTNIHLAPLMTLLLTMNNLSHLPLRDTLKKTAKAVFFNSGNLVATRRRLDRKRLQSRNISWLSLLGGHTLLQAIVLGFGFAKNAPTRELLEKLDQNF